jgi:glucose uptake protein
VLGIFAISSILAFTLGSIGEQGRSFIEDLSQAAPRNIKSAFLGGIVFNAANILMVAAIAIAGMSVAFPVGIGLALIVGVILNYIGSQKGNPIVLFFGVGLIAAAIVVNALAYRRASKNSLKITTRGLLVSILAGILMSFFYRFIAASMDLDNFVSPAAGMMTPYTAVFIFSLGIFLSNFLFNTILMRNPISGTPTNYRGFFKGKFSIHLVGVLGGSIWGVGNSLNLIAAGRAGAAISYGLGQGATLVAALWGVFIWREFNNSLKGTNAMIAVMFILFLLGILFIIYAN